jgi:hypothetical protein
MDLAPLTSYITTVSSDRTIRLPTDVPVGATVAVVLLPRTLAAADDVARRERFERMRTALRLASERGTSGPELDDATLNALIDEARRA